MMKIRLIQSGKLDENGRPVRFRKLFMPSLTMPTVAALTPSDVEVRITEDYVEDIDYDEDVDLVGISALTCEAPRAYQISAKFRERGVPTVLGGIHGSVCTEEASRHFDSVLTGEAEDIWTKVLSDAAANRLQKIYRSENKPDLSKQVTPRYDLLEYSNYVTPPFARTPCISIQTSRGCPHRCDFCSVSAFLGNRIRRKPVENVLKEIETIRPSRIFFSDDNLCAVPEYSKELFAALKPLKIRWACQMSTVVMKHPELLDLAAESGCHEVFVGIESINEESLRSVSKGFNRIEQYKELIRRFTDVGIFVQVPFIFGFDHDTPDSLKKVIDAVMDWHANYMYLFVLTPFPGTRLYEKMASEGRLISSDWSQYDSLHPVMRFSNMSSEELYEVLWNTYDRFYSLGNILRRMWRFRRQFIRFFPRDFAPEEIFFHLLLRRSIITRNHPFSLGMRDADKKDSN